jgi:carbamoyltransferase
VDWAALAPAHKPGADFDERHADLACSVQAVLEDVLLDLCNWLHERTGSDKLALAGGVALNCVANTRLFTGSPFREVWPQPASGDSGTALGAALALAAEAGDDIVPMTTAALGRGWSDAEIEQILITARVPYEHPADIAVAAAEVIAANGVVAWFQGRSEYGPRALGHRSLLAHPERSDNVERLNEIKGREQFRPVAPMVLLERATEIFTRGPVPSPYMLFVHDVAPQWRDRLRAVTHVDGTARVQTVDRAEDGRIAALLSAFERLTGIPVVVNTSLNTAGRPMVDSPRDALELFGSAPIDALAIGPYLVRR